MLTRLGHRHIVFPRGDNLVKTMHLFSDAGLPGCAGAIDGCMIPITRPDIPSGSSYLCRKEYAILLLAVCDAEGAFTFLDVGHPGEIPPVHVSLMSRSCHVAHVSFTFMSHVSFLSA